MSLMELPTDCFRIILYFCDSLTIVNLKHLNKNLFEFINEIKDELNIFYLKGYLHINIDFSKIFNFNFLRGFKKLFLNKLKNKFSSLFIENEMPLEFCNFVKDDNSLQCQIEKLKNKIYSKCKNDLQKENLNNFFESFKQLLKFNVSRSKKVENYNLQNYEFISINRFKINLAFNKSYSELNFNQVNFIHIFLTNKNDSKYGCNYLNCSENEEGSLFNLLFNNNNLQKTENTIEQDYFDFFNNFFNCENFLLIIKFYILNVLPSLSLRYFLDYNKVNEEFIYNLKKENEIAILPTSNVKIPKNLINGEEIECMTVDLPNFKKIYYYLGWELFSMEKKINLINKLLNNMNALYELNCEEMVAIKELGNLVFERGFSMEDDKRIIVKYFVRTASALIWKKLIIPFRWSLNDDFKELGYVIGLKTVDQIYLSRTKKEM
ncbi:hypothetical protein ABK040_011678 [Willaertia magna]